MNSLHDYTKELPESLEPKAKIKIKGKEWKSDMFAILRVEVSSSVEGEASTCYIEMSSVDVELKRKKINLNADFSGVKIGSEIEVMLGYLVGESLKSETVFKGFISAFDVEIKNNRTFGVSIQSMDAKMWMMSNKKTELKKGKNKYSMVVQDICNDYLSKLNGKLVDIKNEVEFEKDIYQRKNIYF